MGKYCVYKHTTPSGKVYIGITSRNPLTRWRKDGSGYKSSPHFYAAIEKYGWENIEHEVLATGLEKDAACQMEKDLIREYKSTGREYGYNCTFGGETGLKLTPEVRQVISQKQKNYYSDYSHRKAVSDRMTGVKKSKEARAKMSASAKLRPKRTMSEKTKKLICAANKAKYSTLEWKAAHKTRFDIFANYGLEKRKAVEQLTVDGEVIATYPSMKEAGRKTGIRDGNISKCCNGTAKTAGGYIWRYAS